MRFGKCLGVQLLYRVFPEVVVLTQDPSIHGDQIPRRSDLNAKKALSGHSPDDDVVQV